MRCACVVCPSHRGSPCGNPAEGLVTVAVEPPQGWVTELRLRVCQVCHDETWRDLARP